MSDDKSKMVILGVCAHPDDLDAMAAGSFAKWAKEGAECYYLICTDGSRGSIDSTIKRPDLIKIRQAEQRAAASVLGVKDVFFLNYVDTELVVDRALKLEIVKYVRKIKPDRVVTTDPSNIYTKTGFINHSDHRAAGMATIDAIYPLSKNQFPFEEFKDEDLKPHKVKELYIISPTEGNEFVDITDTIDLKIKALSQHKTQSLSGNAEVFKMMAEMVGKNAGCKYAEGFIKIDFEKRWGR